VRGGLAGDGRIYLLLLPVLGVVLVSMGSGILLAIISTLTFIVFGFLAHFGWLERWLIVIDNPVTYEHWFYDGLVFIALLGIAVFVLVDFYNYLIKTLAAEQENAERLREAHQLLDQTNLSLEEKVKQRTFELADANRRLRRLVNHDPLTGLPNRILFYKQLDHSIIQAQHHSSKLAILFIDLDNFKQINDSFGHIIGDRLLTKVAERLQKKVRESDTVARLSGDEFAIIIEELSSEQDASVVITKHIQSLSKPFELDDIKIDLSASIGVSIFPLDGENADVLVRRADTAMYRVKHSTKDDFQFYTTK
jgi:diguanylate cyclase (GGDEF)-like protein